ncbi:MAG: SUF system Fe-S cluster assembly protein [Geminicoccaceae bacterium]
MSEKSGVHGGRDDLREEGDEAMERAQAILDGTTPASGTGGGNNSSERMAEVEQIGEAIVEQLQTIFDPEIPVNIYELGLIYRIDVHDDNSVTVDMTLTSPHCPVAESLPMDVQHKVEAIEAVTSCEVRIVWEPPWHPSMMTEEAQLELGMIY